MKPYDNYEISPCRRLEDPGRPGHFYFEVCDPHEADVWTLYGHIPHQGVDAIGDFESREHAEEAYRRITGSEVIGTREMVARLRVMHAAPNLLAACRLALAFIEDVMEAEDPQARTQMEWHDEPVNTLRNAIAEAEGTEP